MQIGTLHVIKRAHYDTLWARFGSYDIDDFDKLIYYATGRISVCVERDSLRQHAYGIAAAAAVHNMVSRVEHGIDVDTTDHTLARTVAAVTGYLPDLH